MEIIYSYLETLQPILADSTLRREVALDDLQKSLPNSTVWKASSYSAIFRQKNVLKLYSGLRL